MDDPCKVDFSTRESANLDRDLREQNPAKHWKQEYDKVHNQYLNLILAVHRKFDGESRHQTALRYITEAEQHAVPEPSQEKQT